MALAEETCLSDARASWRDLPPLDPRYAELREHLLAYQLQVATRLAKLCSYTEVSRVVLERARMFLDLVHPECCARPACSSCGVLCTACFNGSAHMVAGMCVLVAGKEEGSFGGIKPSQYLKLIDHPCAELSSSAGREAARWLTHWEMQTIAWIWGERREGCRLHGEVCKVSDV